MQTVSQTNNSVRHDKISKTIDRYESLYPRLVKQKVKETGIGGRINELMSASNKASKQTQSQLMVKYLNTQQRLQLIYTIAKSEFETLQYQSDQTFWPALCQYVDVIFQSDQVVFSDKDLYICCLFMLIAAKIGKNSEITLLLFNLMTRSQNHLVKQLHTISTSEEASEIEVSLSDDADLQAQMDFIVFILRKGIVKHDLKSNHHSEQKLQIEAVFIEATKKLKEFIQLQKGSPYVQLTQFAPYAIWFEVLYDIFWAIKKQNKQPRDLFRNETAMNDLLQVTFDVLLIYKTNSQYYMVTIGSVMSKQNNSQTGEQTTSQQAVRRMSKLFSEILDLLTSFMSSYLTSVPQDKPKDCIKIFEMLIKDKDGSSFTLLERLSMLSEMNFLFQKIEQIWNDITYWQTIREGLYDNDQACRKLSLNILKCNLKMFQEQDRVKLDSKPSFELLWSTFFDIYDTLESFGSHLTKAVWHRTELFYDFIQKFDKQYYNYNQEKLEPLEDMRMWLLVIYHRVATHNNLKVRRFVQKATLKRKYITPHMTEFFFNEFISWLNQCLIFRDVNNFTQFSKNAQIVLDFYANYFQNESKDLAYDLRNFFTGFSRNKSQSQMTLICLKTLSADHPGQLKWIGTNEIRILLDMIDVSFHDQVMSGRYLCFKYMIRMVCNNLKPEIEEWGTFFKFIGNMPLEFFSKNTIFDDVEARKSCFGIITGTDKLLKASICEYLNTIFTVKAMSVQIPKFGKDADLVLCGITRLLMSYEDSSWLDQTISICLETLDSCIQSTYLQPKLVEQKIRYFVKLSITLCEYGSIAMQNFSYKIIRPRIGVLITRFWDQVCGPLSRDDALLLSEQDKVEAILGQLATYSDLVCFAVKIIHLNDGVQDNALESIIKKMLTTTVMLTCKQLQSKDAWSVYLLQLTVFEILQSILKSYAQGIKSNLKAGKHQIFIQDELFTIGKVILQNLMEFKVNIKPNGNDSLTKDQEHFMAELDYNPSKINQKNNLNSWKILSHLINIFQFDAQLRQELQAIYNKQIIQKTLNFLDSVTADYNPHMFFILKATLIPQVVNSLLQTDNYVQTVEDYQQVIRQCWSLVKQQKTEVQAEELIEFLELSFNEDILEAYQKISEKEYERVQKFHQDIAKEMLDYGSKYWLILRSFFNHLMFMIAQKPHLMRGLESFVCSFGTTRECRSLDAEIKLYKLKVMIPEAISKKYENLPMEEITYQGAYIRTMTLIIIEGIIRNYLTEIKQAGSSSNTNLLQTGAALTKVLLNLLKLNLDKKQMAKSDQPFSEPHRIKLRTWQMLMIMQNIINDPEVQPSQQSLSAINDALWPILKQNHLPSVRQYMECFTIKFVMRFPELTLQEDSLFYDTCLETKSSKAQLSASLLVIAGFVLLHTDQKTCINFKRKIFDKLVGYCGSNSAHLRSIAQYFIIKLSESEPGLIGSALQPLMKYMLEAKDIQKMMSKYQETLNQILYKCLKLDGASQVLQDQVGVEGEFIGINLIEELNKLTTEVMCEFRSLDEIPIDRRDWWKNDLEDRKLQDNFNVTIQQESSNYQRKILPWEQVEFDATLQKRIFFQRRRNQIIMCGVLIDKVANLAGLARTSEIMNADSLIINNSSVCQLEEFKGISVTSEKWLPIYEVKEKDLLDYLLYQKSNGFKIVGIEQTANSQMLHQFQFPTRCVLLLGKEKEGIPQEYYSVLDFCVEIPQFGIIRSLNVHVSGALALWEYTKQHMPVTSTISIESNQ